MIGSTGPTSGQLYIVDTFMVVVFGGAANLTWHYRISLHYLAGANNSRILYEWLYSQSAYSRSSGGHINASSAGSFCSQDSQIGASLQ